MTGLVILKQIGNRAVRVFYSIHKKKLKKKRKEINVCAFGEGCKVVISHQVIENTLPMKMIALN